MLDLPDKGDLLEYLDAHLHLPALWDDQRMINFLDAKILECRGPAGDHQHRKRRFDLVGSPFFESQPEAVQQRMVERMT